MKSESATELSPECQGLRARRRSGVADLTCMKGHSAFGMAVESALSSLTLKARALCPDNHS
jgi:hypothetical protein